MSDKSQASPSLLQYHARTAHRFEAYAEGPGQLDWDAQPAPFRHFTGASRLSLPLGADKQDLPWSQLPRPNPLPPNLDSLGMLLELSFGLSAWKSWGPSRWALRCNPSSGNLHPTECYVLSQDLTGLPDGLHHYDPQEHELEHLCLPEPETGAPSYVLLGLSSVMWREAWKYGERAFRYCQLDLGHALGAIAWAAAFLGWKATPLPLGNDALSRLLGLERSDTFPPGRYPFTEAEEPEILLALQAPGLSLPSKAQLEQLESRLTTAPWRGIASLIDPAPGYRWPLIQQAATASRLPEGWTATLPPSATGTLLPLAPYAQEPQAAALIKQRRSSQRYTPRESLPRPDFYRMLAKLLPHKAPPWPTLPAGPRVHLALFVLRVEGLSPGLYLLPREAQAGESMQQTLAKLPDQRFAQAVPVAQLDAECPAELGLIRLTELDKVELQRMARALSCHQDIASTGSFSLGFMAELEPALEAGPEHYRHLMREAGFLGQILYLEAEAACVRGTGIGCFFDDPVRQVLGLEQTAWQSLYHFTVGYPLVDARIETSPPYPQRSPA